MKIQQAQYTGVNCKNPKNNSSNPSFGMGEGFTAFLNYLQTNQGLGASFVDAGCMCTPRTIVDFSRSPEAGVETARREFSSNINDGLLGAYGIGAAWLLSQGFNKAYGIQANKMPIDKDRMDVLGSIRYECGDLKNEENLKTFMENVVDSTEGLNNHDWQGIHKDYRDEIITELTAQAKNEKTEAKAEKYIKTLLVKATGSESSIKITRTLSGLTEDVNDKDYKKVLVSSSTADDYVDEVIKVVRAFRKEKVSEVFGTEKLTDHKSILKAIEENKFLTKFNHLKLGTAALGIGVCAGLGAAVQPINMYLTKKKTGKGGFVGGGGEDKSTKFKLLKAGVAAIAAAAMFRTIGAFKDIPKAIQFKGVWPTIAQFKLVYGITIISRLLSARNDNELRESTIKDSLGFANWLILGGFVSKLAAMGLEKVVKFKEGSNVDNVFLKYNKEDNKIENGIFGKFKGMQIPRFIGGEVISREEVIHQDLKTSEILNGKNVLGFMDKLKKLSPEGRSKVRYLAVAQFAGYAWSALALGFGIPKLNIALTKHFEKNKQQQAQTAKA